MTRSSKRHRPAIQAVTTTNDRFLPRRHIDPNEVPERDVNLPGTVRRMALKAPSEIESILKLRDAAPPPPGYCYTLDGRLVPLEEIQQRIDDPKAQQMFCEVIEITGSLRAACDALGIVNMGRVKAYMTRDIDFAEAVEAAAERHRQNLYAHAIQRATVGIQKPIIGGKDKDQIVGYETVVSDSLLKMLLQRYFPEFRNNPPPEAQTHPTGHMPPMRDLDREQRAALRKVLIDAPPPESDEEALADDVIDVTPTEPDPQGN